jgi:hypothetical protein
MHMPASLMVIPPSTHAIWIQPPPGGVQMPQLALQQT